jgi:hypothetical protein
MTHSFWPKIIYTHTLILLALLAYKMPWQQLKNYQPPTAQCTLKQYQQSLYRFTEILGRNPNDKRAMAKWATWRRAMHTLAHSPCPDLLASIDLHSSKNNAAFILGTWVLHPIKAGIA